MSTIATPPTAIAVIDTLAKKYADARAALASRVQKFEDELRELQRRHVKGIKEAAAVAAQRQGELLAEVKDHPDSFVKPRTIIVHGIKVGFQKGKGRLVWDDEGKVVDRLLDYKEQINDLDPQAFVETVQTPKKEMLLGVPAAVLKRLGCRIEGTEDQVVVKATDSNVDKLVAKILEEGAKENAE